MAKTRSQTRNENKKSPPSLKVPMKHATKKQNFPVIKDCCVKLDRLKPDQMVTPKIDILKVPKYKLRERVNDKVEKTKPIKPSKPLKPSITTTVALSQAALYTSRAVRLWEQKKKENSKISLEIGDLVCARMPGHRPWPSKIIEFKRNGTFLQFYGTNEFGSVKKSEILPINFCQEIIAEYLKVPIRSLCHKTQMYHLSFIKATKEVICIDNVQAAEIRG